MNRADRAAGRRAAAAWPAPLPMRIGPRLFEWGTRTYVMGIVNVTPDSFSGDGLLSGGGAGAATQPGAGAATQPGAGAATQPGAGAAIQPGAGAATPARGVAVEAAVIQARRMVQEGADILDVGGESTRPGHAAVPEDEEAARVLPVIAAIHAELPDVPISVDSAKPSVADAAIAAGASLINDIWGTRSDDAMARVAAARGVPMVVMHNRAEPLYEDFTAELIADLWAALDRAVAAGVPLENLIVDPGFGFGKTPEHNLAAMRELPGLRLLGRPVLLGTSRKSTLGRLLGGLPVEERLEATLATTALGIAGGIDIVRVHDVRANVRAALIADAICRWENR